MVAKIEKKAQIFRKAIAKKLKTCKFAAKS